MNYPTSFDARRISVKFCDGQKKAMFKRPGFRRDIDYAHGSGVGMNWNFGVPVICLFGLFDIPFVHHDHEL